MILFLDDDPNRAAITYQRWTENKRSNTIWCTTVSEAIDVLKNYDISEAYLDHDLGGQSFISSEREDSGMEVVRYLESLNKETLEKFENTRFTIHSFNIPAGAVMTERLQKLGLKAKHVPFGM